jgi:uncharacterized protein
VTANPRHLSLDALRGVGVMGILLMNIIAFSMPEAAYINPTAWGGTGTGDLIAWATAFVLVDGKMRGLFSLLFGASTLLVIDRAAAAGDDERSVHVRRMGWLLVFGLLHYYLVWYGDILATYAVAGFVAMVFVHLPVRRLVQWSVVFFTANVIGWIAMTLSMVMLRSSALSPFADPATVETFNLLVASIGAPTAEQLAADLNLHLGGYGPIVATRLSEGVFGPVFLLLVTGAETLAFMLLGMALLKNGFLVGQWAPARYGRIATSCLAVGLPPMIALAGWCWAGGFDPVATFGSVFAWSAPFRPVLTVGIAALSLRLIVSRQENWLVTRIAAAGRAAFTNYLGTSIVMTTIFYGYGLGLYGQLDRATVYLVVLGGWAAMLLWSKPWLDRFAYGPLEWLWRSLARGQVQPFRRISSIAT